MNILVTGATGYVGHALALRLAETGHQVHILVRDTSSRFIPCHNNIRIFKGDITDRPSVIAAAKNCRQVYHVAGMVKLWTRDRSQFAKVNVEGTRNVLVAATKGDVEKLVFTSSCAVLGPSLRVPVSENDPRITSFDNDYEFTKKIAEDLVNKYYHKKGLATSIVALSKVYGPGIETQSISVNRLIGNHILGKLNFSPKPDTYEANYCFINDVVNGHILAMEKGNSGEKYILGGENVSYNTFFKKLHEVYPSKSKTFAAPKSLVRVLAGIQWLSTALTGQDPSVTLKGLNHIYCNKIFSSDKAVRELGYQITPLSEGLRQTIRFLKDNGHD